MNRNAKLALAEYFYEQCAGTYSGHMSNVPNNPQLFTLIKSQSGMNDNCYAATRSEFAEFLEMVIDVIDG